MSATHEPEPSPPAKPSAKPGAVVVGLLVFLVGEFLILANSGIDLPAILPEANSSYAAEVDLLFYVILAIVGFFFLLTEGLLIYFIVRYRARDGESARHTHGNHALELTWTFIPGLILFCLAVFQTGTWGMIKFKGQMPDEQDENVEVVRVFGKQFEWHFAYAGPDGEFGTDDDIRKKAELRVPVGRPVVIHLQTRDVLHSFWLPNSRLKQDLLPGQTIKQWFQIEKAGEWPIVCAELCGNLHTTMSGKLISLSEEEYRAWLEKEGGIEQPPIADDEMWRHWRTQR